MEETLEIYLNSATAQQQLNGNNADCVFHLPVIGIDMKTEKVFVSVKSAVIPYSFYNVNDNNNKLNMVIDEIVYNFVIPVGNYNVNTLSAEIILLINQNMTINYSAKLNKYIFSNSHNFTFLASSTCFEILGFKNNNDYTSALNGAVYQITSTIGINLFVIKSIYVSSNNFILQNINSNNANDTSLLASISVTGQPNSIIYYQNANTKYLIHHLQNITNLHIKLTDQNGNQIYLNDINWQMTIEITILKR